jgi:hypothetical protein
MRLRGSVCFVEKEIFGGKNTKRSQALTLSHNFLAFLSKAAKKRRLSQAQAKKLAGKLSSVFSCTLFRKPLLHDCDDLCLLPPPKVLPLHVLVEKRHSVLSLHPKKNLSVYRIIFPSSPHCTKRAQCLRSRSSWSVTSVEWYKASVCRFRGSSKVSRIPPLTDHQGVWEKNTLMCVMGHMRAPHHRLEKRIDPIEENVLTEPLIFRISEFFRFLHYKISQLSTSEYSQYYNTTCQGFRTSRVVHVEKEDQ